MKTKALVLSLILLTTLSCDKDDDRQICGVSDPATDLPWLKARIEEMSHNFSMYEFQYVSSAKLGSMTVFIFGNCCPNCMSVYQVYSCSGQHVGNVGDATIDQSILDNDELVWKAPDSACTL